MKQRDPKELPQVSYPLPKPGLEALKHLRKVIEPVDPEHFNMDMWWCGTIGCAIGHAAHDPTFQAMGFRMQRKNIGTRTEFLIDIPVLGDAEGYKSAEAIFDISSGEAEHLFRPSRYYDEMHGTTSVCGETAKRLFLNRLDQMIAEKEAA